MVQGSSERFETDELLQENAAEVTGDSKNRRICPL